MIREGCKPHPSIEIHQNQVNITLFAMFVVVAHPTRESWNKSFQS